MVTFKLLRRPRHSIIPCEVEPPEQAPAGDGHAPPDEVPTFSQP